MPHRSFFILLHYTTQFQKKRHSTQIVRRFSSLSIWSSLTSVDFSVYWMYFFARFIILTISLHVCSIPCDLAPQLTEFFAFLGWSHCLNSINLCYLRVINLQVFQCLLDKCLNNKDTFSWIVFSYYCHR